LKKIAVLALGLFILLSACGKKREGGLVRDPNYLKVAMGADAKRLIPMLATDSASGDISGLIFQGLTKYDKDIKITGDLAENWDISKDGLVITFHLRKNVKWQDGKPFTADDVLFTYKVLRDPNTATPYSDTLGPVDKVEAPDPYTVRVTYKEPFAPALEAWGMGVIPKHLLAGKDINKDPFNRHPIGTNMFKFGEWVTGNRIVLDAYDDYFEGRPHIDKYVARILPDQATEFLELKTGGIDLMNLTPMQYSRETDTPDIKYRFNKIRYPAFAYDYLGYNLTNPLFQDKRVRQALSYAIDQKGIIQGVLLGLGTPCTGPFPPESWAYNKDVKGYPYDPEKAKAMLKEAGWTPGPDGVLTKDGRRFAFTILVNQANDQRKKAAEIIQQDLAKVGVQVSITALEWQALLHDFIDKKRFEALIMGWALGRDPDAYDIWDSSKTKEGEFNFVSYKNPEVDKLLIEGRQTFDIEKRKAIYHRIQAILSDDAPYTFLYVPDALPIIHKRFKGVKKEPLGIFYNLKDWYVPKNHGEWYTQ
jgi:peptide/nickel transport system substrate-binding protein